MEQIETLESTGFPMIETGEEAGLRWGIALAPRGVAVNGYVQLNPAHPLFETTFDPEFDYMEDFGVSVHGGITYFKRGIIGFDTMHAFDIWTEYELAKVGGDVSTLYPPIIDNHSVYWTKTRVIEEVKDLAKQLADME